MTPPFTRIIWKSNPKLNRTLYDVPKDLVKLQVEAQEEALTQQVSNRLLMTSAVGAHRREHGLCRP